MDHPRPRDAFRSPRFGQPASFMLLPYRRDPAGLDVALLGIPYDGGTSYRPGARHGPRHIREQSSMIRPWNPVLEVSPFERLRVADYGDVDVVPISIEGTFKAIERELDVLVGAGVAPLSAGGDHSVTLPILRSLARRHGRLGLVHFDAHPDTWDEYFGSKYFHGTTFRRAIEEDLIDGRRVVQIGIRGPLYGGPVYCSFDIDAVDPAYAPATGTPEVGGLTSYEALSLVRSLRGLDLVGADVVEVSPPFDGPGQITSLLAANLLFELLSVLALRK